MFSPAINLPTKFQFPEISNQPKDPEEEESPAKLPESVNEPVSLGFNCLLSSKAIFFLS